MTSALAVEATSKDTGRLAGAPASRPVSLRRSLPIGRTNDPLEHEADRVARELLREPAPGGMLRRCACGGIPGPEGECAECRAKRLGVQRASAAEAPQTAAPPIVHDVLATPGRPLGDATRSFFEPRLGLDLDGVRVHADALAARSAEAVEADAYTVGSDIAFAEGRYAPGTSEGDKLLAHELVHVLQQRTSSPSVARQGAPAAGAVTIEHCSLGQAASVTAAIGEARIWMSVVEPMVSAYAAATASPAVANVVSTALQANFHTVAVPHIFTIAANFTALRTALNGPVTFQCASEFWCGADELAYVRGAYAWMRQYRDINVCPLWFVCGNPLKKIGTVIHEIAHQYPGASDRAYETSAAYAGLPIEEAIVNTDSYTVAARQIYYGGAHGPGEGC